MSPSRKSAGPRGPRKSHVPCRHDAAASGPEPPAPPPPAKAATFPSGLRAAAAGCVHTAITGAFAAGVTELREGGAA